MSQYISDDLRHQTKTQPDIIAFAFKDRETSYAQLNDYASQVAQGLLALDQGFAKRVGFLGKNSDLYFHLLCGAQKARAVVVGVNSRLAGPEVSYVLNDAGCEILFIGKDFYDLVEGIIDDCPKLKKIIAMDGGHGVWQDFAQWRDAQDAQDPMLEHKSDDTVIQLYTSGTTGHPKGVETTNENLEDYFLQIDEAWSPWNKAPIMLAMPLFHIAGVNVGLNSIRCGCTAYMTEDVDPGLILELLETKKIRFTVFVPAVILLLMQHPKVKETDFSHLEEVIYGASPIAEDLLKSAQEAFQCKFRQVYGMTETTASGTILPPEAHKGKLLRSCGRATPRTEVQVVDKDDKPVPVGEVGEIVIKTKAVMKCYWNNPQATKEALRNGWMHTGDMGYFDDDGWLFIYDRLKDMIVSGGENVYPAEVENALFAHPDIADVAVIGVPDDKWGEAVKAMVVKEEGTDAKAGDIINWARERLAGYKLPKSIDFIDSIPRNPSGKILRRELRAPFWEGKTRRVN